MKIIDADKLREEITERTFNASSRLAVRVRDKILKIIDEQPEIKAPFKAVTEIKIDKDQLEEITKQAIDEMKSQMLVSIPDDSTVDFGGWIPVKKRLPKADEDVLLSLKVPDIKIGHYEPDSRPAPSWWTLDWSYQFEEVVAWRPLPEPYRE